MPSRYALLVSTLDYDDPDLRRLQAPKHDVRSLAAVLKDPQIGAFEVRTIVNGTTQSVAEAIADFYDAREPDDLTLLYFTGHGLKDASGTLYLALKNTKRSRLIVTGLSTGVIDQIIDESPSRRKIVILDCCYSGAFPFNWTAKGDDRVGAAERLGGQGRVILTSSDATQYSFEGPELRVGAAKRSSSLFTRFIVEGLRTGEADLDNDGNISLDELYRFAYKRVVAAVPNQRPKKTENIEGSIVFASNAYWRIPADIEGALASSAVQDRLQALQQLAALYRAGNKRVRTIALEPIETMMADADWSVTDAAKKLYEPLSPESFSDAQARADVTRAARAALNAKGPSQSVAVTGSVNLAGTSRKVVLLSALGVLGVLILVSAVVIFRPNSVTGWEVMVSAFPDIATSSCQAVAPSSFGELDVIQCRREPLEIEYARFSSSASSRDFGHGLTDVTKTSNTVCGSTYLGYATSSAGRYPVRFDVYTGPFTASVSGFQGWTTGSIAGLSIAANASVVC